MEHSSDHFLSGPSEISVDIPKNVGETACEITTRLGAYCTSNDATLFSSSLPILSHDKLNVNGVEHGCQCTNDTSSELDTIHQDLEVSDTLEEDGAHVIGSLLPDDEDELLAGIMDDFDLSGLTSHTDDAEECDLFGNVGGMELENDPSESLMMAFAKATLSDDVTGNGMVQCGISNAVGTVAGEHPYGEHPSRTLFVRNINSNIEDSELKNLFEQYGDIRTLYTSCKHRGFVMISYYDIRAARTALRALQNKQLRRRKLDIHFSIPKDNPSDKDINQGTLVVFNLDPSVSNDDLRQIFGAYGEIKEIRETPHKRHHKFIEFYDVRAAEAALRELNRSDIAGKRIKLEPSRPGGARRNLMLHPNQELEQDDSRSSWHPVGSPLADSPPGIWGAQYSSPIDNVSLRNLSKSPGFGTASHMTGDLPGLASILHPQVMAAPIGRDHGQGGNHMEDLLTGTNIKCPAFQQSHSLPEPNFSQHSTVPVSSFGGSGSNGSFIESLSGQQFLWGSPDPYLERSGSPAWPRPSMGHPFASNGRRGTFLTSAHHPHHNHYHHVGSAPSPSSVPLERRFGFSQEFSETSFVNPLPFGGSGLGHNGRNYMVNMDSRAAINGGVAVSGKLPENSSPSFRMMSPSRLGPMFLGGGLYPGLVAAGKEGLIERGRNRRMENNGHVIDGKKQFQLDLDNITNGEDNRTTLMIKNIPNKYTSKMLLATIDELNRGTYDFLYLPIDFKNKCNVGYAFINMLSPKHIIPFYAAFNGKKWEKFNSEKVASLAYARIQGKAALVAHFQNSSLMNEDKRCRPILFYSEGGDQEHLPSNSLNIVQVGQSNGSESDGGGSSSSGDKTKKS